MSFKAGDRVEVKGKSIKGIIRDSLSTASYITTDSGIDIIASNWELDYESKCLFEDFYERMKHVE